jgi:hypothetical protein
MQIDSTMANSIIPIQSTTIQKLENSKDLLRIEIQKTKQERERTKQESKKIILKKLEIKKLKMELELKKLETKT